MQEVSGFIRSRPKTLLTWLLILLSGGLLRLVFHWLPELMLKATHSPCSLKEASKILIVVRPGGGAS